MPLKRPKKLLLYFPLAVCLVCLAPARAAAWGDDAHQIIARIAAARLTDGARAAIAKEFLDGKGNSVEDYLVKVSTYADEVRMLRPETSAWHFVDMPRNAEAYVPQRDCVETARGDCAVAAIRRLQKILGGGARAYGGERAEALAFLVHLVGDLHQPLHCGYKEDYGGNSLRVNFFGSLTNLHSVWDARMLDRALSRQKMTEKGYAAKLNSHLDPTIRPLLSAPKPAWVGGSLEDWAFESHTVAVKSAYALNPVKLSKKGAPAPKAASKKKKPARRISEATLLDLDSGPVLMPAGGDPATTITQGYYDLNVKIMDDQLLRAGVRLAAILNDIFQ